MVDGAGTEHAIQNGLQMRQDGAKPQSLSSLSDRCTQPASVASASQRLPLQASVGDREVRRQSACRRRDLGGPRQDFVTSYVCVPPSEQSHQIRSCRRVGVCRWLDQARGVCAGFGAGEGAVRRAAKLGKAAMCNAQRRLRPNLSNAASLLWHAYHSLPGPSSSVNWSGFYFTNPSNPKQLLLGPFHGQVACQTIAFGRGVCGAAAQTKQTQLVADVEKFPGHIACDGASKSEIVVPVIQDGKVVAIIDIDCAEENGFIEEDQKALEELAALLAESCDF
ncbi:hypothetical protein OPT61_g3570 [Boeremia exigua]|uniref:Uncharacterized protein n=1 Tax=Boeremia exigua TaxID=749465 RepID=A0ACC2IHB3_9PLEO|nr:hypothetical protein OPT61_g3570 [Boeremia exigua]